VLAQPGHSSGSGQPGQINAAVATVRQARAKGRTITEAELDEIRNVCAAAPTAASAAIKAGADNM
jgi:isoquinoline 1-oxidoreductase alpha subunit